DIPSPFKEAARHSADPVIPVDALPGDDETAPSLSGTDDPGELALLVFPAQLACNRLYSREKLILAGDGVKDCCGYGLRPVVIECDADPVVSGNPPAFDAGRRDNRVSCHQRLK